MPYCGINHIQNTMILVFYPLSFKFMDHFLFGCTFFLLQFIVDLLCMIMTHFFFVFLTKSYSSTNFTRIFFFYSFDGNM